MIDLLGVTLLGPQSKEASGVYDNGTPLHGFAFSYYNFAKDFSSTGYFDNLVSPPPVGVFLMRPNPEPATGFLVLGGLLALAARERAARRR